MVPDNTSVSTRGHRVVVVGATGGIGLGVALQFAKTGAEVWIVGRNLKTGNEVIEKLKQAAPVTTPAPQFRFFQADCGLIKENVRVALELADAAGEAGIDHLFFTHGGPAIPTDVAPNEDGLDSHFAVMVVSRFVLAHHLTLVRPTVKRSVVSIAVAGHGKPTFDLNDITLEAVKKNGGYSVLNVTPRDCTILDAVALELAERNPSIRFMNLHPGFVRTPALENPSAHPLLYRIAFKLANLFLAKTIEEYAQIPFYLVANPEGQKLVGTEAKATHWDNAANPVPESPALKSPGTRKGIWEFLVGLLPQ